MLLAATGATHDEVGHRVITVDNPYARDKAHLLTSVADPLRWHTYGAGRYVVRIYGFRTDLERVELLYTSLLLQTTRELVHVRPDTWGESTAAYRRSWLAGFASAVATRLHRAERRAVAEQPSTPDGTSTALVLRDRSTLVENAVTSDYPRLRTMRHRDLTGSGRSDGFAAGARADLGAHRLDGRRTLSR